MATEVYFNAVAQPTDGSIDKTEWTGDGTTATREFTGQGSYGGLSEFAAWEDAAPAAGVANVIPGTVSLQLQRKVDDGDANSWLVMATINAATSRIQQAFPNGTYRVTASGFAAEDVKIVLKAL